MFTIGCGSKVSVQGTVRFEDGTPLKTGTVHFESPDSSARGELNADGHYVLESTKSKDGVLPGTYRVYIMGASESGYGPGNQWSSKPLIDSKFQSPDTSQLACEVSGKTTYDIKVTAPASP